MARRILILAFLLGCPGWPQTAHAVEGTSGAPRTEPPALGETPRGRTVQGVFEASEIFPGTRREWSVYVPAEYSGTEPARLMVFQDGPAYATLTGAYRAPLVFDALIAKGEMPVTVAVFVTPGTIPADRAGAKERRNRSFEYDTLGDRYARFLVEELLPVALDGLNVSADPRQRAICGQSSGGICAFTAAWERPDQFGRVMSHIGSFTDIRGGYAYPVLVRKSKPAPKPIRVYLQEGRDDLDNLFGNWPLANADMVAALAFAGYGHRFDLTEGGHSGKAAGAIFADGLRWLWSDEPSQPVPPPAAANPGPWEPHPLAVARDGVPRGRVERMPAFESQVFPGTVRDWAIYVPAQARPDVPAALMVFQDGHAYLKADGRWRVPVVFDNLIASGKMPPTVAVFLDPGHAQAQEKPQTPGKNSNRSFEYDSLGDRYARFLLEEILPEVAKQQPLTSDPALRAIGGASSGGICAFTVAWERPDQFGRVLSTIGSFTGLRGGHAYPSLVRKTEPKPIRVYLADTSGDNDNLFGSWPLANKQLAAALEFMGYDVRFDWAEGYAHDAVHASRLFPEALSWLWRDERHVPPPPAGPDLPGDMALRRLLVPGADWEVVAEGLGFADAPCADAAGNIFFCDMKAPAVYRIAAADGSRTTIAAEAVSGLEFGPDGLLYGCQGSKKRLIAIDPVAGTVREVAADLAPNDLAILPDGTIYVTETGKRQVTRIDPATGAQAVADTGITGPNGIALSNDSGTLAVSDFKGGYTWTFRVRADGTLDAKAPTMEMRRPIDAEGEFRFHEPPPLRAASGGDGMAVDRQGRWYVTSALGVQVFDPLGRLCGVIRKARPDKPLTSCILAGADHDVLFVTNGDAVYRRRLAVAGPGGRAERVGPWNIAALQATVPAMQWLRRDQPIHSLTYAGETYRGHDTDVFAFYASPVTLGEAPPGARFPGVVLIHGGGGTAFADWVHRWAKRGYAAIAMDLNGSRPPDPEFDPATGAAVGNGHRGERPRLPHGGPAHGPAEKFDSIGGDTSDDWPFHAAANVMRAHTLLRSFPEVDAGRTAVTGISWGGYTTCLVAALDDRFKAAVPVYGCGFLHEGESVQKPSIDKLGDRRALWVKEYDPGSLLPRCTVPILFVNGTNDVHYVLDSSMKSYAVVPGEKHVRIEVQMPHGHPSGWAPEEIGLFIDSKCRGGTPLPVPSPIRCTGDALTVSCVSATALEEAAVHYTTDTGPRSQRTWKSLPATIAGTTITAPRPPADANTWFVSVTDDRGAMVTTPVEFVERSGGR